MKKLKNPLIGRWRVESLHFNYENKQWIEPTYASVDTRWEFVEEETFDLDEEGTLFLGTLREFFGPDELPQTYFGYNPDLRLLYIDRLDFGEDGFILSCVTDRYRVLHYEGEVYRLFNLEDVECEPDDYWAMLKITRIP